MSILPTLIKQKHFFDNKKLRIELNKIQLKKIELKEKISNCLNELENSHIKYKQKCTELDQDIRLLNAKLNDDEFKNNKLNNNEFKNSNNELFSKPDFDLELICKNLFRGIAKRTHPDVIIDKNLNELFIKAEEAYNQLNLLELQRINEFLDFGSILEINNLNIDELAIENKLLQDEILKENKELNLVLNSVQFRILNLINSEDDIDNMVGDKIFLDLFLSKVMQLKKQKDGLLNKAKLKGVTVDV